MSKTVLSKIGALLLPLIFSVFCAFPSFAQTENTVTIQAKDIALEKVMQQIEKQTRCVFLNKDVDVKENVSVNISGKTLSETLNILFKGKDIDWKIDSGHIIISKKVAQSKATEGKATTSQISGVVIDEEGVPVIGVGVLIQGTTIGTGTDLDGNFSFVLPEGMENSSLEFSCLGYTTLVLKIGNRRVFNVTMTSDAIMMEGTVVTALGIKRSEKALSYNVQQVNADEVTMNKDANFINSLNGKVAGLNINASSSGVGGASKVVMRGMKSISQSSNALYVIDGVPMYTTARDGGTQFASQGSTDPIADINPEDIESISVLTGAAAAALYGSDAANGAIVVTTKKGKEGKLSATASASVEFMTPFVLPRFQNRYGTGDLNSSIGSDVRSWGNLMNDANNPKYSPAKDYFQTGVTHNESVSVSMGNEKNQSYLSGSSIDSYGIVPNNRYNRYNFTFRNTTSFLKDKMHLDFSASFISQTRT